MIIPKTLKFNLRKRISYEYTVVSEVSLRVLQKISFLNFAQSNIMEIPSDIKESTTKSIITIRNIHEDLTDEDISGLFTKVAPVEFFKFNPEDRNIGYLVFEDDKFNYKAIKQFNGKKAMGNTLVVEESNPKPLKDRIITNGRGSRSVGPKATRSRQRGFKGPKPKGRKIEKKTAEQLDAELTAYMNQ